MNSVIVWEFRVELDRLLEQRSLLLQTPVLPLRYIQHGQVPLWTLGGQTRSAFKNGPGFLHAFCHERPAAIAHRIAVAVAASRPAVVHVGPGKGNAGSS